MVFKYKTLAIIKENNDQKMSMGVGGSVPKELGYNSNKPIKVAHLIH